MCSNIKTFTDLMRSYGYTVKIQRVKFSINGEHGTGLAVRDKKKLINTSTVSPEHYEKYKHVLPIIYEFMAKNFYNYVE